ncbi:hypothetical protein ACFSYH_02630 [Populibacterium corticicola]|uniref:Uncharacterized protein n=1 Tax=Populibacterium corticicola TaxID=1812826 RepID=A0ABW5XC96_9MICO
MSLPISVEIDASRTEENLADSRRSGTSQKNHPLGPGAHGDRLRAAKAALAAAETKQGLRAVTRAQDREFLAPGNSQHALNQSNSVDVSEEYPSAGRVMTREDRIPIPVHPTLTALFPNGLHRGAITVAHGSTHTALALLVQHTQAGGWAGIVGAPELNYSAAHDLGVDLSKLLVVPHPADHTPQIIATLIDGTDLILLGPHTILTPAEQRTLAARAKERGTHIITGRPWPGARTYVDTTREQWAGTKNGLGRLTSCTYNVDAANKYGNTTATLTTHNGRFVGANANASGSSTSIGSAATDPTPGISHAPKLTLHTTPLEHVI